MGNLEIINITLDTVAIVFSLLLAISTLINKTSTKRVKVSFLLMITANILMTIGDLSDWTCRGTTDILHYYSVAFGSALFFVSICGITVALFYYEKNYLQDRVIFKPIYEKICWIIFTVHSLLAITSPWTGWYFSISSQNEYFRGPLYLLANILPASLAILVAIENLRNYKEITRRELIFFLSYALLPLIAAGIQIAFRGIGIMNIFITIAMTLCYTNVQSEYESNVAREEARKLSKALVNSIEAKYFYTDDHLYTKGHSIRVANYSRDIARNMGFSSRQLEDIFYIALLHDVGKVGIPDYIINKKGKLNDEEYSRIKEHTTIGAKILRDMPEFSDAARHHHERYDGKGYPDGLKENEIPLFSRIIAVADSYDAMSSSRIYRKTMPQNEIYQQIMEGKGTQFDPEIADIMLKMIENDTDFLLQQLI